MTAQWALYIKLFHPNFVHTYVQYTHYAILCVMCVCHTFSLY